MAENKEATLAGAAVEADEESTSTVPQPQSAGKIDISQLPVEQREARLLKPHPLNAKLYGTTGFGDRYERDGFERSVCNMGVLTPLLITPNNVIISGHNRANAAKHRGMTVPVQVYPTDDPLEIRELLIHSNKQRRKTKEQIAREYKELKAIEQSRAEKRLKAGKKSDPSEKFPKGRASDIAAAQLNMSGKTAEKLAVVVETVDDLEAQGKHEEAAALVEVLETKSVDAAHRKVKPKLTLLAKPEPEPPIDVTAEYSLTSEESIRLERLKSEWKAEASEYVKAAFLDWAGSI